MRQVLDRLHAKMGDLWWYSLMIFVACRSGDVIQAFIGLWLVPKYVGPQELGAIVPLQQLSGLFTIPLAVIATVFTKYVNTYATRGEYGKVRCFIRDVFFLTAVAFLLCILVAYLVIPQFYVRLNVVSGALTILILASGLVTNVNSLFASVLQGLKKFGTMSLQAAISAPIRLVTLLVAMPFRPLSGYILGQTTPPATCSALAAVTLHRELKRYPFDTGWRRDLKEISRYLLPLVVYTAMGALNGAVSNTVYRQRLPEIESAAYYMLSRFAEMSGYIGCSVLAVLVPLASEAHERGRDGTSLLRKSIWINVLSGVLFTALFACTHGLLFSLTAEWRRYAGYASLLPLLTMTIGIASVSSAIVTYEIACRRFKIPLAFVSYLLVATGVFVMISGVGFFRGIAPDAMVDAIEALNFNTLENYCWYSFWVTLAPAALLGVSAFWRK